MPYEIGGRADKHGNRFETRWIVYQILEVLDERLDYITIEALGDDERGVDIWIGKKNGVREGQQCKGRNGSKEYWDFGSANSRGIFENWKFQLDRDESNTVALVSPLSFTLLEDLSNRAKNTSDNPQEFYSNQILNASKEFIEFFKNFCKAMNVNSDEDLELIRCISYLKRITYRQFPDSELKEIIFSKISYLFIGNEEEIYNTLVAWIFDGNHLGKKINQFVLYKLLSENEIKLKNLAVDDRIVPRLEELNREYKDLFVPLDNELIIRQEFIECRKAIESGNSLIIHGKAGRGKSGCTEDIITYCQENNVPFLAIKLDKRIPSGTAEKWGKELGLPSSIAHCIHSMSKTENAVIILDQLDALRWTQAHSRDALLVCNQIINQVERLNIEREYKISVVFVCRTYDLENDNNIKSLFKNSDKKSGAIQWDKIQINELTDDTVKVVIGNRYESLTGKLKEILRIPSNLYIWKQLDKNKEYNECSTANHLVLEWWKQLASKGFEFGLSERDINETKEKIISHFEKLGRICIPLSLLSVNRSSLDFLSSNGFLMVQDNKISFAHQSILDCFLAEEMLKKYYEIGNIVEVIRDKEKQTPGRRYQVQMLLQNLIEFDSEDFLSVGRELLNSEQIRFSVKFVFFEVLNQLDILDENIRNFIIEHCEDETYGTHLINSVIYSKPQYIRLLRKCGVLDNWFDIPDKKDCVFNLFISMSPNYDIEDVAFIEKHAFQSQEDDYKFSRCFFHDINQDSDEMFELRMKFYQNYPEMADAYIDFKAMLKNCEMRTMRVFTFLLENKLYKHSKIIYKYEEEFLQEDTEFLVKNGIEIIDLLLPYLPTEIDNILSYSDWSGRYTHKRGLERTCIQILKKANAALIGLNPEAFWERYKEYMGLGNDLFNEIILDALYKLPSTYSDSIINYLCSDFESNIFEATSGNGDELLLVKKVLAKHSEHCSQDVFNTLEKTVIGYISPRAIDIYKHRLENRKKYGYTANWSFWGDLQNEILEVLPYNRLSDEAGDLLCVLRRKFLKETSLYKYSSGHAGFVGSPIAGKKLSDKKWLDILTNKKLNKKQISRRKEVPGGFIESSIDTFSSTFSNVVSAEPERMILLVLSNDNILNAYTDSLFSGVAHSEKLNQVPIKLLEEMILKYLYDYTSYRASSICSLIENREDVGWSQKILDILKDIAINHKNPEIGKPNVTSNEDKEMRSFDMLQSNAINCVRGKAATAIAHLLWKDSNFFEQFKVTIEKLVLDENPAVRFASLVALWPSYIIDREWASEKILELFEQDYRLAGFQDTRRMFFLLCPQYRQRILTIIKQCFDSEDEELVKMGAHCLTEMFILKNEFVEEMTNVDTMSNLQAQEVLYMVMLYFNKDEYNSLAKDIILRFNRSKLDLEMPISRLFYDSLIDLERDKDFLIEIMNSDLSRRTLHAFVYYLEEESKSVIEYNEIIFSMSRYLINNEDETYDNGWGVQDEISKLIIGLYDETSGATRPEQKSIANECLDIWDLMFEKQIGQVRRLSREMMER
ncbi:hypothetical protein [Paenibacillus woosongensis]|uniref:ATPase AAA-type core domain-containing protein n=1 Tax=Paenibacillus woosongensis TaxID=307580 RepID=A0ABQ4MVD0_9BACL|nr:hypothetical protein [Paenibacillus woosongensis]GIP59880.1 hypothetical protein J15TS10_36940 [Paenibacillus woosongensis]